MDWTDQLPPYKTEIAVVYINNKLKSIIIATNSVYRATDKYGNHHNAVYSDRARPSASKNSIIIDKIWRKYFETVSRLGIDGRIAVL